MPNDVVTLSAISKELDTFLNGGKVEKIYQPETDEITLTIKSQRKIHTLVISANPSHPRIHLTSQKKENSLVAPAFCMLMRKYLIGATIQNVSVFNSDRIIKITFNAKNDLKDTHSYFLMVELMGRYSNIILTDVNMKILDAIRRIHFDQSTTRYILPNLDYVLQPQNRISLSDVNSLAEFFNKSEAITVDEILKNVSGFGKETAMEIAQSDNPLSKTMELININNSDSYSPCLRYQNGKLRDYYVMPYSCVKGEYEVCDSLNDALDKFYILYDGEERKKASTKTITTLLKRLQSKTIRRINDNNAKLLEGQKGEQLKLYGELILSYSYMIKKGTKSLVCTNYYDNTEVTIPLDDTLSPADNAQSYFKKYSKLKRACQIAKEQLITLKEQQEYLQTIEISIENCSTKAEYDEILTELNALLGVKKKVSKSKQKEKPTRPIHFFVNGYDCYCGKNNIQNVETTFSIGTSGDTWLHVKNHHGAHVIIKGNPDEDTIYKCAQVAAFYSEAKKSDKVEVDYTLRKFVKKIPSAMPGMVTYTNYQTFLVKPCDYTQIQDNTEINK